MDRYEHAAQRLWQHLVAEHWNGKALLGPDPGPRFSYRIGRFVKSYLPKLPWNDSYYYLQAQGYWVIANWRLFALHSTEAYRATALQSSATILEQQRPDGAWSYPHPEWRGRIANFEGTWGALGLLETYRHTNDPVFLKGALRWHAFLTSEIGFEQSGDELSVNYFAHERGDRVPNTSTLTLRFLSELASLTGDTRFLQQCRGLLTFLGNVQKPSGEMPYTVTGPAGGRHRPHFQCYQYNAFQCLNLIRYHECTGDPTPLAMIERIAGFLRGGLAPDGHAFYDCDNQYRAVTYHAAALGAAFTQLGSIGIAGYETLAERAYNYVLGLQQSGGGFVYSRRDYRLLSDRRSYPRYLCMMLYHLLHPALAHGASEPRLAASALKEA